MSQQNKVKDFNLFANFKTKKAPKAKKIVNYFSEFKDLYKFEKEYVKCENDNKLTGFSYIDLIKKGFDIFNNDDNSYYGYYNGNSKFNVEFQKAQENYDYFKKAINELDLDQDQNEIKQDQNEIKQDQNEVNNDSK